MQNYTIRTILPGDNQALAKIIRDTLTEFNAAKPGSVYYDPTTDDLHKLFQNERSRFYTALIGNEIVGGAGIYPTDGLPDDVCELCKMYLVPSARGIGLGRTLIQKCVDTAREIGYKKIYLESFNELTKALSVYEKFGFKYLDAPFGNTGHYSCNKWMIMEL
ncbi:MAG TPA: GNAT family N-acetyltransferase [Chitinophagaceae bacterium]|nr:GNAT family N-acetyltransferase [Chitinophagaceae bacterium]